MKEYGLNSAEYIKCLFIDYLLSQENKIIIGNELMYGIKRKLTDLIVLKNNKSIAIEIKSEHDNLQRINEQIIEYKKIFNYVIIVTTNKHKKKIVESMASDIGIYIINKDLSISLFRKPLIQKNKDKTEMLYSINARYLMKLSNYPLKKYNADEIRWIYAKKRISFIEEILFEYWANKYQTRFELFIRERGIQTHIEDLSILSSSFQIE